MKRKSGKLTLFLMLISIFASAQSSDTTAIKEKWEFSSDLSLYFFKDDFIAVPVIRADKGKLHLEARYNYESEKTFSAWGGYNISGGESFEYLITPMAGFIVGDVSGLAPGLEMTFAFHGVELYTESEYFIDPGNSENDFFYNWSDLTWSPLDWLWIGISGQRTRLYQTDVDIQRGVLLGAGYKDFEFSGYFYNPGSDDYFFLTALSFSF